MLFAVGSLFENILCARQKGFSIFRERDVVRGTNQQLAAQLIFQSFDVLADGRLRDTALCGGNGKGERLRYENKGTKMS